MSKLSSLIAKQTIIDAEFPNIEGFVVKIAYLGRDDLIKIRNKSLTYKFNTKTRQKEEEVDNEVFVEEYVRRAVKGWSGLKFKYLPQLLPVDISNFDPEDELEYTEEDALELAKNSTLFDSFITDVMNDYEKFSISKKETAVKNSENI